jgi:hypothetical protein
MRLYAAYCCLALLPLGGVASGQDIPGDTFAGETLFEGGVHVTLEGSLRRFAKLQEGHGRVSDPRGQRIDRWQLELGVDYGLIRDLTLSFGIPLRLTIAREREGPGRMVSRARGFGDPLVALKWRVFHPLWRRGAFNFSVLGGVGLPLGRTSVRETGRLLDIGLQPGSGAWRGVGALLVTTSHHRLRFDAQARYDYIGPGASDVELGDQLLLTADFKYRVIHLKYPGLTAAVRTGLRWRWSGRARDDGRTLRDSGSRVLLVRSGVTSHPTPDTDLNLLVDVPVYERYHGRQLGFRFEVNLVFGYRF